MFKYCGNARNLNFCLHGNAPPFRVKKRHSTISLHKNFQTASDFKEAV